MVFWETDGDKSGETCRQVRVNFILLGQVVSEDCLHREKMRKNNTGQ